MKKLMIPFALLLMWVGNVKAADANATVVKQQTSEQANLVSTPAANISISILLDENVRLRQETEALQNKVENLSSRLDYSQMMHTSIDTLKNVLGNEQLEAVKFRIDYMQMMHVTLLNLNQLMVSGK